MARSKPILVTGGAGFIGSHLCDQLIAAGEQVICLDDFSTGDRRNVGHLSSHRRFALVVHDVTDPISIEVGSIYHLACPASPAQYQKDPIRTTRTAVVGTLNVLDLAARLGCRVLLASTSEVYGNPATSPQREDYWGNVNPIGPRACYDEGKRCAESLCFDFHRKAGVEIKVARLFNTYGPRMQPEDGRVVSNFIVQALGEKPVTLYGDGLQTRSFCYVDDIVTGLIRLMGSVKDFVGPVNLGSIEEISIVDLAREIIALTGTTAGIVNLPMPPDDPTRRQPDVTLARRELDWRPNTPLSAGLGSTIAYFRDRLGVS
ncbi:MAG: UDP-glucuronic acid decarboxylase family protein [Hyphomicrobiaceae bacterium]